MHRTLKWTAGAVVALIAVVLANPVAAGDDRGGEFGVLFGLTQSDENLTDRFDVPEDYDLSLGLRVGNVFSRHWGWYLDGLYTDTTASATFGDADVYTLRTGLDFLFAPESDNRFFVALGAGWTNVKYSSASGFDYPFASLGIGQRIQRDSGPNFRWELRADQSIDDEGPYDDSISRYHALLGLTFGPRGVAIDSDGDGVHDRRDACPDTPRGAVVDERGCPKDTDGDGVYDGIDACPDTPRGWPVDNRGCPKDSDSDGVPDGADKCPDTPSGATVDAEGCPKDSDGDGVYDGIDKCPNTAAGVRVNRDGCPADSDGDGVTDALDKCPDTPRGTKVDATGCPADSDGDGVTDDIDKCPGTPSGTKVDATGCPEVKLFEEGKRTLVLEGVNFEVNKAVLTPESRTVLDRVAQSLKEWTSVRVEVAGHTDSTGADDYNQNLSLLRAGAVRDYLISKGVPAAQLESRGYGESRPIADNNTNAGRGKNRRVELERLD